MFSAYDIKKIIPRAVMALVGINLSWALMDIFIRAVNALGESAYGLILAPFSGTLTTIDFSGTGNTFSAVLAVALGLAIGSVGLGLIPILGVAVAGATGILLAFAVVMIRRVALIGLIIVAPLAIAAGILPQTESWFKKWWDWFSKLMLMYPFVMAFFALSRVASGIISQGGDSGAAGMLYQLGAVAILIAPYFLIGKAFSLAGGAIGKVAGIVNNKDKGLIDKTKKWEAGRVAERRTDARAGSRYGGRNFVTRGINTALRSAANPRTVIGTQEERDARVLAAIQQNAGSMEARMARFEEQRTAVKEPNQRRAQNWYGFA
ncbi:MAG: type IV secretion system protein [Candidatus Nomurabacteria bacterium]|nr:MAG: type IV secretion system protein [Candidatus Nomurabacteria bacterium]